MDAYAACSQRRPSPIRHRWRGIAILALILTLLVALVPGSARAAAAVPDEVGPERVYFSQTGHYLAYGFLAYWHTNGGITTFGYPITEEMKDPASGLTVQYFERARFEYHPGNPPQYQVLLGLLGSSAAQHASVNQASVPKSAAVPVYNPGLWYVPAPAPSGPEGMTTPPPGAPISQAKWIEVDLSSQYLRAWEHSQLVFGTYVSTGLPAHPTPTGTFQIYEKLRYDDMSSGTPGVDYYYLPNVPYVMYFYQAYALHGTYWHHNFGNVMSHGCVNLPTDAAAWTYNWAPLGTVVWIHN